MRPILMSGLAKAAVQDAACGLVIGLVLLIGGRVWQGRQDAVPVVVKAKIFQVVDEAGTIRASISDWGLMLCDEKGIGGQLRLRMIAIAVSDSAFTIVEMILKS